MKHLLAVTALATGILASLPALAQDKTVVSFLHKFPEPENMAYFDAAVAEFEAANPSIDIVMEAVVELTERYMPSRQLPDKAVSLLDTACARVASSSETWMRKNQSENALISRSIDCHSPCACASSARDIRTRHWSALRPRRWRRPAHHGCGQG